MNITFFLAEIYSYNICILKMLNEVFGHNLKVFCLKDSESSNLHQIFYKNKFDVNTSPKSLIFLIKSVILFKPKVLVVAGWMDLNYIICCFLCRLMGVKVILIMDTQYNSISFIKRLLLLRLFIIFRFFIYTHAWVPGLPQYYMAVKLGFRPSCIMTNLLSADDSIFCRSLFPNINAVSNDLIRFIFVGRLVEDKGLEMLASQWQVYYEKFPRSTLTVVGVGPLDVIFDGVPNVNLTGYLSPLDVAEEMSKADCFILPSLYEPWGVVIHEAACMGLPLICSEQCGASTEFLIDDFNGYKFSWLKENSLAAVLIKFSSLEYDMRKEFGRRSLGLAGRVTPIISASKFDEWIKNF